MKKPTFKKFFQVIFSGLVLLGSAALLGPTHGCSNDTESKTLTYEQVVYRLTDLRAISKLPAEGEYSGMFSSYDRNSRLDPETNSYLGWDANGDGTGKIRMEGENEVMVEMEGPGAIVRIWSATADTGRIIVYIDGEMVPELSVPFIDYFNHSTALFSFPGLVYQTNARGYNNYVPITFRESIKIVGEPGWGRYYHFNYVKFPEGTELEPFHPIPEGKSLEALNKVNDLFLNNLGEFPYTDQKQNIESVAKIIQPGTPETFIELKGEKAITSVRANVKIDDASRIEEVLRKTVIRIRWDNQEDYSVWSPLGDFFGTAPGINHYNTYLMGMNDNGMFSYWYMPFESAAEIEIFNESEIPLELELEVTWEKLKGDIGDYTRFHAKWHRGILPVEDENRWPDWTFLKTEGSGRYAGLSLVVWSPKGGHCREYGGPGYWWWGEGDEKFFVDGEKFPSTFGTGTEDYFGYAWCDPNVFNHALHSQSLNSGNMGYQPVNRWHTTDNVPFHSSFEGTLEKYFPDDWPTQYAAVVYWYLDKDGTDPVQPTPVEERYGFEIQQEFYVKPGVIEAETMKVVKNTGDGTRAFWPDESLLYDISDYQIRVWNLSGTPPAELVLEFESPLTGKHKLLANIVARPQGSNFSVSMNDKPLPRRFNSRNAEKMEARVVELGEVDLQPGKQTINIAWEGDNLPTGRRVLNIDYFEFIPKQ
jgi:hypothetical protein